MIDLLNSLNPEQREAAEHKNGPLLIVAGAGSGKTRVLTYRIATLIDSGVKPWSILALTFTNKAAREMKNRIASLVNENDAQSIWAGTFHSIFGRILRYEAEKIGYTSSYTIYDADDQLRIVKKVMAELGISTQQYQPQHIRSTISNAKNKMKSWQEMAQHASETIEKQTALIYEHYEKMLKNNNAMDFDDLLLNFIKLLRSSKELLKKYQERFRYILVDEYQDTNRAQYIAINLLAKAHQNLCVVGDDAQSIYRWRGADIQNILDFQKDYPYAKVVRLEQNYRSTKNILQAADSVIKNNVNQLPKTLWTENPDGEKIDIISCGNDQEEAIKIVSIINTNLQHDFAPKDFAILYRTNAQSLALENALRKTDMKYVIVGGVSFYQRKEIKDAVAYFKVLINPKDAESLERIVNEPPRGIGQTSLRKLRTHASQNAISLFEAFEQADFISDLTKRAKKSAVDFANMIRSYANKFKDGDYAKTALEYIEETGLLKMYKEINTEDALDRWNNIQQLLSDISIFFRNNPDSNFEDYIQQISLSTDLDNKDIDGDRVTLMTLHSAKGLEFPIVFIAGLEKGLFPLAKAEHDKSEEEEERRLFYVGITRAKEKLFITHTEKRMRFGEFSNQAPSKFLFEIDERYISWKKKPGIRRQQSEARSRFSSRSFQRQEKPSEKSFFNDLPPEENYSQIPDQAGNLKPGDRITHGKFGKGKIISISGAGDSTKAVIMFDNFGRKNLMMKFAKLQKI